MAFGESLRMQAIQPTVYDTKPFVWKPTPKDETKLRNRREKRVNKKLRSHLRKAAREMGISPIKGLSTPELVNAIFIAQEKQWDKDRIEEFATDFEASDPS